MLKEKIENIKVFACEHRAVITANEVDILEACKLIHDYIA